VCKASEHAEESRLIKKIDDQTFDDQYMTQISSFPFSESKATPQTLARLEKVMLSFPQAMQAQGLEKET
jgi:hypothetical protein